MKSTLFAGLIAATLLAAPAWAQRAPEPIVDYRDQPAATTSGKPLQPDQVKQAIVEAAAKARLWTIAYEPNGTMLASRAWNDHVIVVAISWSADKYSLVYRDSTNMKYAMHKGVPSNSINTSFRNTPPQPAGAVIHPFYNRYVKELKDGIGAELRKL